MEHGARVFMLLLTRWWDVGVEVNRPAAPRMQPAVLRRCSTGLRDGSAPLFYLHSWLQSCTWSESLSTSPPLHTCIQQELGGSAFPTTACLSAGIPPNRLERLRASAELISHSVNSIRKWLSNIKWNIENILTKKNELYLPNIRSHMIRAPP